jgi:hypothetical protein
MLLIPLHPWRPGELDLEEATAFRIRHTRRAGRPVPFGITMWEFYSRGGTPRT